MNDASFSWPTLPESVLWPLAVVCVLMLAAHAVLWLIRRFRRR